MSGQVREGKTKKDKRRGHVAGVKNRTMPGDQRGHLNGLKRSAWVKRISKSFGLNKG